MTDLQNPVAGNLLLGQRSRSSPVNSQPAQAGSSKLVRRCPICTTDYQMDHEQFNSHVNECEQMEAIVNDDFDDDFDEEDLDDDDVLDGDESDSLTPPPADTTIVLLEDSPFASQADTELSSQNAEIVVLGDEEIVEDEDTTEAAALHKIRTYVDKESAFTSYDAPQPIRSRVNQDDVDDAPTEESEAPEVAKTCEDFKFPELTSLVEYQEYLAHPHGMSIDKLNHRLHNMDNILLDVQKEWEDVDAEIFAHEEREKYVTKMLAELAKDMKDKETAEQDIYLLKLSKRYDDELSLPMRQFHAFCKDLKSEDTENGPQLAEFLNKLKDTTFRKSLERRQKALKAAEKAPEWIELFAEHNVPKITKEEENAEKAKRKRSRLTDVITFDDMNQAAIYGFEYTAADLYRGDQPLPNRRMYRKPDWAVEGTNAGEHTGAGRTRRKAATPANAATEVDEPEPRSRSKAKPKRYDENTISRTAASTPALDGLENGIYKYNENGVRVFKSGNRVGRPKKNVDEAATSALAKTKIVAKSKLKIMHRPSPNEPSEPSKEINYEANGGVNVADNEIDDVSDEVQVMPVQPLKPKGKGGRPRKYPRLESVFEPQEVAPTPKKVKRVALRKSGHSIKKEDDANEESVILQSTEQADTSASSRPTSSGSNSTTTSVDSLGRTRGASRQDSVRAESQPALLPNGSKGKRAAAKPGSFTDAVQEEPDGSQLANKRATRASTIPRNNPTQDKKGKRKANEMDGATSHEGSEYIEVNGRSVSKKVRKSSKAQSTEEEKEQKKAENKLKTSNRMKDTWASGKMDGVNEKRIATNQRRKARKDLEQARILAGAEVEHDLVYESDKPGFDKIRWAGAGRVIKFKIPKHSADAIAALLRKEPAPKLREEETEPREEVEDAGEEESQSPENYATPRDEEEALLVEEADSSQDEFMASQTHINRKRKPEEEVDTTIGKKKRRADAQFQEDPSARAMKKPKFEEGESSHTVRSAATTNRNITASTPSPAVASRPTRTRKPTARSMGLDGAADEVEETKKTYASKYDEWKTISSPGAGYTPLGKRIRKPTYNTFTEMDDDDDDDDLIY